MGKSSSRTGVLRYALAQAISTRDIQQIRFLLEKEKFDPNKNPKGSTLLHVAVKLGDIEFLQYVLAHNKTNTAKIDTDGRTALQFAIETQSEMAKPLLSLLTPSQLASECPYRSLVKQVQPAKRVNSNTKYSLNLLTALKEKGITLPCVCGHRLAHEAMKKNNAYFLDVLLTEGADANEENPQCAPLLQCAARFGHLPTIRTIIMHGAQTWDSEMRDICELSGLTEKTKDFIRQLRKRRAVFYILKFRDKGVRLFSGLSFWLVKEIIAII